MRWPVCAAFVAVASQESLALTGLGPLAQVVGAHHAQEPHSLDGDTENLGVGLSEAVQGAVRGLRLPAEAVDELYGDINGERHRSEEWGFASLRMPELCRDASSYHMASQYCGDLGAASGGLYTTLAVQAWGRGYARGPRALLWAGSDQGLRAAVLLQRVGTEGR